MGLLLACSRSDENTLRVFAASSLTEAFHAGAESFEGHYPGVDVQISVAGSQVLAMQIERGAPADVFASANLEHLDRLVRGGRIQKPTGFARNQVDLIVPLGNPAGLTSLKDLSKSRRWVLGGPEVPIGRYGRQVIENAAIELGEEWRAAVFDGVVSHEPNVRLVRAKVVLGEADAGLVYRTDGLGSDRVLSVPIDERWNLETEVVMGSVTSGNQALARQWMSFWNASAGQEILVEHGFRTAKR